VLFIIDMKINLLSVSSLDIDGFGFIFFSERVFLYPNEATLKMTLFHGVKHERLYRLFGQPLIGSSRFMDLESIS
jgi:hypothetical protein